jgi:ribosomal protein L7/L12
LYFIDKKYLFGSLYIIFASSYLFSYIVKKPIKTKLSEEELNDLNVELKELLSKGNKIEAIKKYRIATGNGLLEAKEYIDIL